MPIPHFAINPLSGGQQGVRLRSRLERRLPADRLHLLVGRDLVALCAQARAEGVPVVVCGGDGSVSSLLDASWHEAGGRQPVPVGIIPLGTGNDLARIAGWGGMAPGARDLDALLGRLAAARPCVLDRWLVEGPAGALAWFNYLSMGSDARIARRFHRLRRHHPWLFRYGALGNKALYGVVALAEAQRPLGDAFDAPGLRSPAWMRALVCASIPSYAGGACLANGIRPDDGRLDLFALGPGAALGLAAGGMRRPRRLACAAAIDFTLRRPVVMQVDGEPSIAIPGRYRLRCEGQVRVLAAPGRA